MIRSVVAGLCFIAGVVCMWGISKTTNPWLILGLFAAGILFGMATGIWIGIVIRRRLTGGMRVVVPLTALAVTNLIVFALLGKPVGTREDTYHTLIAGAFLSVMVASLVALNAYLLGVLLMPGKKERAPGLRWTVPIYASILIGVVFGTRTGFWQRGTVPFEPLRPQHSHESSKTWEEALADVRDSFPPEITSERIVKSETRRVSPSSVETRTATREAVILRTSWINAPRHSTVREVIQATASVVTVGGDRVEFVGYGIIPPGSSGGKKTPDDGSGTQYWSLSGEPLKDPPAIDFRSPSQWQRNHYLCALFWDVSRGYPFDGYSNATLTQLPWKLRRGASARMLSKEESFSIPDVSLPVPGPADVTLRTFVGEPNLYTTPAREGEILNLETNRLLLARLFPWPAHRVPRSNSLSVEIEIPTAEELKKKNSGKTSTTAVFCCAFGAMTWGLRIDAVLDSGEKIPSSERSSHDHFLVCQYEAAMDEIKGFRILEVPGTVDIHFSIPELRGLPLENKGITSRLDLHYGTLRFSREDEVFNFLETTLGDRFYGSRYHTAPWASIESSLETAENVTIRDILNVCYPGRWWVANGVVYTTSDRFGPIGWRVKVAWKALGVRR